MHEETPLPKTRNWPALDGLRATAVTIVILYHLAQWPHGLGGAGYLGVDVFFVISGFLITTLIIGEYERTRTVSFRNFYARRVLRLGPALVAVLVIAIVLAVSIAPPAERTSTVAGLPFVAFYIGNLAVAFGGAQLGLLQHTWSLSIEEQFYLVWPAVCVLIVSRTRSRSKVATWLVLVVVFLAAYRVFAWRSGWSLGRISYGTDTHADGLVLGSALAFFLASPRGGHALNAAGRRVLHLATVLGTTLLLLFIVTQGSSPAASTVGYPLAEITAALLVWSSVASPVTLVDDLLSSRLAVWVGRRSYGLYLWHFPIQFGIVPAGLGRAERGVLHLTLFVAAAALSYRYIEQPFLKRKRRFQATEAVPKELLTVRG